MFSRPRHSKEDKERYAKMIRAKIVADGYEQIRQAIAEKLRYLYVAEIICNQGLMSELDEDELAKIDGLKPISMDDVLDVVRWLEEEKE